MSWMLLSTTSMVGAAVRCLTMLLEKVVRMIAGKCWDCVLAALLQTAAGLVADLQNCVLGACRVEALVFPRGFRPHLLQLLL